MVEVIHAAFGARPPLDPPSTASAETPESVAAALRRGSGVYAKVGDRPAGVILVLPDPDGMITFQRVSVHPEFQRHGIASAMVSAAEELAATLGHRRVELFARAELAELVAFWQHRGFAVDRPAPYGMILAKPLPLAITVPTAQRHATAGRAAGRAAPAGRRDHRLRRSRGRQDHADPGHRDRARLGRPDHLADLRAVPDPSVRPSAAPSWCTSTPIGSADPRSSTISISTPPWTSRSPWSSGARTSPSTWPTAGSNSICGPPTASTAARVVMMRPIGPRWHAVDLTALDRMALSAIPLVLALDTSTVVNVGVARGEAGAGDRHGRRPDGPRRAADAAGPRLSARRRGRPRRHHPDRGRPRSRPVHRPAGRHRDRPDAGPGHARRRGTASAASTCWPCSTRPPSPEERRSSWPPTPGAARSTGPDMARRPPARRPAGRDRRSRSRAARRSARPPTCTPSSSAP